MLFIFYNFLNLSTDYKSLGTSTDIVFMDISFPKETLPIFFGKDKYMVWWHATIHIHDANMRVIMPVIIKATGTWV